MRWGVIMRNPQPNQDLELEAEQLATEKAEREAKLSWIGGQVKASLPVDGTPAEKYLTEHRGLQKPFPTSLRWAPKYKAKPEGIERSCMLSVVTNSNGKIVAVQSLQLNPQTGTKAATKKPHRYTNGSVGEGAVFLGEKEHPSATLVIGEGVETTLTRNLVSHCDGYACLGGLRIIAPQKHHKRVEILSENNNRDAARRLAREYADDGLAAYVVTLPDNLGERADLNDALRELGLSAVRMAVEDAEVISNRSREGLGYFDLEIGSDVEIAQRIIECLEDIYGTIIISEGKVWRFDRTHWVAFENDHLARFVHRADGAVYSDSEGKQHTIKLNKTRVNSILDALFKYRQDADYFKKPPIGINCESGFLKITDDGAVEQLPHARQWRARHLVRGKWHGMDKPANTEDSSLARYLRDAFKDDVDAAQKVNLLAELAGCAATGRATKLKNPKAAVCYSEEGGTGKSTFLRILRAMPNPEAVASVPAGKFGDEKYAHRLIGKILNAADELPDKAIRSDVFKRMVTGEPIPARDVYCSAVDFEPTALHVFSTNVLPAFSGGIDGGTARRLLPLEFTHVVPEGERDSSLPDRIIHDEADLLLHFAVEGACRLIKNGDFTVPSSSKILLNNWLVNADPVRGWAAERLEVTAFDHEIAVSTLYRDFEQWADMKGLKREFLPSAIAFGKRLPSAVSGLIKHRSDGSHYKNARLKNGGGL